jgi:ketosteroid isomerase-like protein
MSILICAAGIAYADQQIISLKQGFNFVSFTVAPDATPAGLKQQNSAIGEIYLYSAAAGSFLSTLDGTLSSLNAGKGYIIYASSAASITVSGTAVTAAGNITLKAGFNLIGISKTLNSVKFSELISNNSSVKGLYKWNTASGSFIQVVKGASGIYQLDGVDPVISSGQSYFLNMASDSSLNCDNGYLSFNSATTADEEAIRNIYSQYVNGIKTKNISSIMALYSDSYLNVGGDGLETKTSRQAMLSGMSYSSSEGTAWNILSMKISASSAMVAVHCKTVLDGAVMEDETYTDDGTCYLVKENGKWLIIGNQKQWTISGFTAHFPNNYQTQMYVDDPEHKITSVTMEGPGVSNSSLIYGFYSWMPARWSPNPMPAFGASKPSTDMVYNFTIVSAGKTYTETLNLGREFIDEAPALTSPADQAVVSSKPTFTWSPVSISGAVYRVEIVDQSYKNIWNGENASSLTTSTYTGTLLPGTYMWCVVTRISGSENASFTTYRTFKVQ